MHIHSTAAFLACLALPATASQIVYVDSSATGANTGASWNDAFVDLQSALGVAASGDEVWVAAGTYLPGATAAASDSFFLVDGVRLYGGFAGGETNLAQRDWVLNPTVLSGDIGQDDVYGNPWYVGWNINTANSAHVLTALGVGATTVVDGFVVRAGATGPTGTFAGAPEMFGGGLYSISSSPTLEHCTFERNLGAWARGSAIYNLDSSPTIRRCTIRENWMHMGSGAGIFNEGNSAPVIEECTFTSNIAVTGSGGQEGQGAALGMGWTTPPTTIARCTFEYNSARQFWAGGSGIEQARGGGISSFAGGITVRDCVFRHNDANAGAAIFVWGPATIVDCLFAENDVYNMVVSGTTVSGYGSAIGGWTAAGESIEVVNCTLARNHVVGGESGAVYGIGAEPIAVHNSILWGNTAPPPASPRQVNYAGLIELRNTCVEGLFAPDPNDPPPLPGDVPGCIGTNPQFVDLANLDLHLSTGSGCIDTGSNALVPGLATTDLDGNQRVVQGASSNTVDMGAYEFGSQPPGPCPSIVSGPAPQTVIAGASASFDVLAMGAALTYQWRKGGVALSDGGQLAGTQTATLVISPASAADAGSYDVVVANACTAVISNAASLTVNAPPLAQVFCSGDGNGTGCPCGNDKDFGEGCENSTGDGARLGATGTASVAADDAVLTATFMPANKSAIVFMGSSQVQGGNGAHFGDGLLCVHASRRFPLANTGATGSISVTSPVAQSAGAIQAGSTVHFQAWFRDPAGPCGLNFNTSNALSIAFVP